MKPNAEQEVRKFWKELSDDEWRVDHSKKIQNRYNMMNLLAGFLQACERLGCMNHQNADDLFNELTTGV